MFSTKVFALFAVIIKKCFKGEMAEWKRKYSMMGLSTLDVLSLTTYVGSIPTLSTNYFKIIKYGKIYYQKRFNK